MKKSQSQISRTISRVAIVITIIIALCLPASFFALSYQYQIGAMQTEADFNATLTTQYITLNPEMWRFQEHRLRALLEKDFTQSDLPEHRSIIDATGQIVVSMYSQLDTPVLSTRAPLFDTGNTVGYFKVSRSLRPLLLETGVVGFLALTLAAMLLTIFKLLPMRALSLALNNQRQSEELFSKAFHVSPDPFIIYRMRDGRIINVNHSFTRLSGYSQEEVIGTALDDLHLWATSDDNQAAKELLVLRQVVSNHELSLLTKTGERRDMLLSSEMAEIGDEICLLMVARDVSEQKRSEQRLSYLANYDHLTGLPNRVLFRDRLTSAMQRAHRAEHLVALLYLDLDRFKQVNDSLGHQMGDELLRQVTVRLQQCMRSSDTLAPTSLDEDYDATVARLGGDEFTIVLEDIKHIDEISRVAQRILTSLSSPFNLEGHSVFIGASIGITVYPFDDLNLDNLIRNADIAMYRAKALGRNNFQFYTDDLNTNAEERLLLETELRQALERHEFELFYQAKMDLHTQHIDGVEALIRWNSPRLGLVAPDNFIPFLEDTGLIVPVGAWVLHTACAQAAAWARQGLLLNMAVNLSARQFRDNSLTQIIETALRETGFPANRLELEVTEGMLMEDSASSQATLSAIKQMGIHISVDDFGTGYSSLAYLKRFPIDTLKIDRSFVHDLGINPDDTAIVKAVIALAHSLRLNVVAEGVETLEQLVFLRTEDCEQAQGYHINRPMPVAAFETWLSQYQTETAASRAPEQNGATTCISAP